MENRTAEYQTLVNELARPPKELTASVERARRRARHTRMLRRFTAPLGTIASVAACFVLMVNIFPTFALACPSSGSWRPPLLSPPACPPPLPTTMYSISGSPRRWMG